VTTGYSSRAGKYYTDSGIAGLRHFTWAIDQGKLNRAAGVFVRKLQPRRPDMLERLLDV
jgi:hypothetical protein